MREGSATTVIARFGFVRPDPMRPTVAEGFDLDAHDSGNGDSFGCRQGDFTAPDGRRGIDNQLARLLPTVDMLTGGALDGAIQAAINNGQLLVTFTVEGMENRCDDPSVEVLVRRVSGSPFVGSDMLLDPGQTFDLQRDQPVTRVRGRITGRVLRTDTVDLPLPVAVLGTRFILNFYHSRLSAQIDDQGAWTGAMGGGIDAGEFTATVSTFDIPNMLRDSVGTGLRLFADLDPNEEGRCQRVSAAVSFTARPAFLNP